MSRLYFHSPTGEAAVSGAEFDWLRHVAQGQADAAWDARNMQSAAVIVSMLAAGGHDADDLRRRLHEAQANPRLTAELTGALVLALHVGDLVLEVHGVRLRARDVGFNACIVTGSDTVVLAAKIHGWVGHHAWIDGPDRGWVADLVDSGLRTGVLRRGFGWEKQFATNDPGDGVLALLRERDDEPVVLSHSYDEPFPDPDLVDTRPALGHADPDDYAGDRPPWSELSDGQRWDAAFEALTRLHPWAQLSPRRHRTQFFGWPLTPHDLLRADRADHLCEVLAGAETFRPDRVPVR